ATQTRSKFDYDKSLCKGTADQWIIGQLVDLWRPKKPHVAKKFWKPWRGPYRLCRVEWPNVWLYRLDDPQQRVFGPEHVNNLKHYKNHYLPPLLDRPRTAEQIAEGPEDLDPGEGTSTETVPPNATDAASETPGEESFLLFPELVDQNPQSPLLFGGPSVNDFTEPTGRIRKKKKTTPERDYSTEFLPGSLVWGKLTGYVAWPGLVVEAMECPLAILHGLAKDFNRCIHFFGDNTYQILHVRDLVKFEGISEEQRTVSKSRPYQRALAEIEEAYRAEDLPLDISPLDDSSVRLF
ncbi:MAG: PWWP domain-containing protein, partial [Gammaproteobacteria bacterium]|nr:PWWP domain-containing protein [Gammaproteobacteria bacterium]